MKYNEQNLIVINGKGKKGFEIFTDYLTLFNEGFNLAIDEACHFLGCSYRYFTKKLISQIKHIRVTTTARKLIMLYGKQSNENLQLLSLATKRILFERNDFFTFVKNNTYIEQQYQTFAMEPSENRGLGKQNPPIKHRFPSEGTLPDKLYSLKELKEHFGFRSDVEVYRFIRKFAAKRYLVLDFVRYNMSDFNKDSEFFLKMDDSPYLDLDNRKKVCKPQNNRMKPKNNLPASLAEFVGRKKEIETLSQLLDDSRLVTLIGSGGIGKTRLSLQIAFMRLYNYSDGVYFIPLAAVTQIDSVISNISKSLNIIEIQGQPLIDTLKTALHEKKCLIILDNFEQVIEAAAIVSELLACAPELTIMVTSREPLGIYGEHLFYVPPLDFPDAGKEVPVEHLSSQPAVHLFLIRAKLVKPDFKITEENAKDIIQLCACLEGIPLAIELAAANIGEISIRKMLSQSQNRLNWLTNGPRDLDDRQRTLQNTIEWGYILLTEPQQKIFRRLGIFKGKFDLKAAQSILNYNHDIDYISVEIRALLRKSILMKTSDVEKESEEQFYMLETIREYAISLLSNSTEEDDIKCCHCEYYLSLVLEAEENMNGYDRQRWLAELEYSHSNIMEALKHLQTTNNQEKELKLAGAMGYFWEVRGYWGEGISILESIIGRYGSSIQSKHYIKINEWLGRLNHLQGEPQKAVLIFKTSLMLARQTGDRMGEAAVQYKLALAVSMLGNLEEEEKLARESYNIYREIGYKPGIAEILQHLSLLSYQKGEYGRAEEYSSGSLKICKELRDRWGVARALGRLGLVARGKGDFDQAKGMILEYLTICEELNDKEGVANALVNMAELSRSQSDYDIAQHYYMRSLKLAYELGYKAIIPRVLKDMGEIQRYKGDFNKARELYVESLTVLKETGGIGEMTWLYRNMAELELQTGNYLKAQELYLKGLKISCDSKQNTSIFVFLVFGGLAGVAAALEKPDRAARLYGAADRLFPIVGNLISKSDILEFNKRLAELRGKMNTGEFDKAWNEGCLMSFDRALGYAMEVVKEDKPDKTVANKMIHYIHENFSKDISLDEMSGYFHMTPAYLSTVFKCYTGYNYKDYLNSYRVKMAKELLKSSNLRINEVAAKVGCNNTNTFIRIFKKYEGVSPGQYCAFKQDKD